MCVMYVHVSCAHEHVCASMCKCVMYVHMSCAHEHVCASMCMCVMYVHVSCAHAHLCEHVHVRNVCTCVCILIPL